MKPITKKDLIQLEPFLWEIPKSFRADMRTAVRVFTTEEMLEEILQDRSLHQIVNVSTLPGILGNALAMPDVHEGYGFPVGGVAAFDIQDGIISPGGIGYDINCGVRLIRSEVTKEEIADSLESLGYALQREIPSGVGKGGNLVLNAYELEKVLTDGARAVVKMGYGSEEDLFHIESEGCLSDADPDMVSDRAKKRGRNQVGTLGAGNHFVEVQYVGRIIDEEAARDFGVFENQVMVMIHTGSRGLGHQIATDYIRKIMQVMPKYGIEIPDRELACAPFSSDEGQEYFRAMAAGANFAWANRQVLMSQVRKAWREAIGVKGGELELIYDVAHNIAKVEEHSFGGKKKEVVVHRKGATRAFPGQPVLIPGSMGTASYLLVGEEGSMQKSLGSSCHGAGRRLSRTGARKKVSGYELKLDLEKKGITIMSGSTSGLAEEAPIAYKDVHNVVDVVQSAGIAKKVAELKPLVVVKG